MKKITYIIVLLLTFNLGYGQIIAWEMDTNAGNEVTLNSTTLDLNLNTSTLSRGSGINPSNLGGAFSARNFTSGGTQATAITDNDYLQFEISASSGYKVSLSTLDVNLRRSSSGPNSFIWKYSIDGILFTSIGIPVTFTSPTNGSAQTQIDLSVIPALQNVVFGTTITFRLYAWGATSGGGTFAIGRLAGNDLQIDGVVLPACTSTVTWDGATSTWIPSPPISSSSVTINGAYNTFIHGSFSACSLTVSNGATLNIDDNDYIEVQNNLTINTGGSVIVQPSGTFIQNNDFGAVTNDGLITVAKETAPANAWYEYTYWSSPVSDETVGQGLIESGVNRRFIFKGQNFLDATAETGNNDAAVPGQQDDIDDNGDDWVWVDGTTTMTPGVGYAATHDISLFNSTPGFPKQIIYNFEGAFNNGVYNVPIYRNDSELNDYNWNFIGNPYPSAIDADLFLEANSNITTDIISTKSINGAIFLWSQATPPSATANGNQQLNFSNDDYAIINAIGQSAGGDMVKPSRIIPSGQGFFVSMSNTAPASVVSGSVFKADNDVVFNNSMRVKGATDNSQFFKNSNIKEKPNAVLADKLWINLTSDNGVFNQILVGYVNGATNDDDGISFDTAKYPVKGSALYTTIEGSNNKFAIQGKAPSDLNENEIINLGFKTTITVATLYTISIDELQGDFLNANTVYLKDNLLNVTHDLSASNYTFTSEVGEFNARFQIGFNTQTLSNEAFNSDKNTLSIIELEHDNIQFSVSNNTTIKSVLVFDMLGRQLYNLKGKNSTETYTLSNLKSTVYIAKVELSNGAIITKKAVKK